MLRKKHRYLKFRILNFLCQQWPYKRREHFNTIVERMRFTSNNKPEAMRVTIASGSAADNKDCCYNLNLKKNRYIQSSSDMIGISFTFKGHNDANASKQ